MSAVTESSDDDGDGDMRIRKTALEELTGLVRTKRTLKKGLADRFGEADNEAENLTGKPNIYVALDILFASLKRAMAIPPQEDTIVNLCAICWILARSRVLQSCIYRANGASANLMIKLGAMGAYYRGVGLLHQLVEEGVYKRYFEGLKVEFTPLLPESRKVELHDDWFHVMQTIYSRVNGGSNLRRASNHSTLSVSREYRQAVQEYTANLSSGFTCHPEKHLVRFLVSQGYHARDVGVSRYCCVLCVAYFEALNSREDHIKFDVQNHERVSWNVGGRCGDVGMWARDEEAIGAFAVAEDTVRLQIEKEICNIAKDLVKSGS